MILTASCGCLRKLVTVVPARSLALHTGFQDMHFPGAPVVAQQKRIQLGTMRLWVRSLALLSGLRIQHCCELWCRSQMTQILHCCDRGVGWQL